jgi:hypothetical protein
MMCGWVLNGRFSCSGEDLRKKGLNRIGNLLVPNDNYCKFEDWVMPILDAILKEQEEQVREANYPAPLMRTEAGVLLLGNMPYPYVTAQLPLLHRDCSVFPSGGMGANDTIGTLVHSSSGQAPAHGCNCPV